MSGVRHFVQTFSMDGDRLLANQPQQFETAGAGIKAAKQLAELRSGVVALSVMLDAESDIIGWPIILFRAGRVPRDFASED